MLPIEPETSTLPSYVLVTPARNEAAFIEGAIQSVVAQTHRPLRWVIVSDGSTDGTDEIVERYAERYPWIVLIKRQPHIERNFGAKVRAFNTGYEALSEVRYEVIGNLDADITFNDPEYFSFLTAQFAADSKLGVCGSAYREGAVLYPRKMNSAMDVFGGCQLFRRKCFEAVGGYEPMEAGGIDVVVVLKARLKGWKTQTFMEKVCLHHRTVSSAHKNGFFLRLLDIGRKDYVLGSHPWFEVFRSVYLMKSPPFVVGGIVIFCGYFSALIRREKKLIPLELLKIRQRDQLHRLRNVLSRVA